MEGPVEGRSHPGFPSTQTRCGLPPFPDGWFLVELSKNLPPGKLISRRWLGERIVAWRDPGGGLCVARAVCPHMGASLCPETGGRLAGGNLVCPFHGFEFDSSGACAATPNAPPPPACRLHAYAVQEVNGFIFAYRDHAGRPPDWRLPELDDEGWTDIASRTFTIRTHSQDIAENSVDINHLNYVHGWDDGAQTGDVAVRGRHYMVGFSYSARPNLPGFRKFRYAASPVVHVWGLGYTRTDSRSDHLGVQVRNWFLPIPLDGERMEAVVAIRVRAERSAQGAARLAQRVGTRLALRFILYESAAEFAKDVAIWNHRHYLEHPKLCASDGSLFRFRRYCSQFYPEGAGS